MSPEDEAFRANMRKGIAFAMNAFPSDDPQVRRVQERFAEAVVEFMWAHHLEKVRLIEEGGQPNRIRVDLKVALIEGSLSAACVLLSTLVLNLGRYEDRVEVASDLLPRLFAAVFDTIQGDAAVASSSDVAFNIERSPLGGLNG